MSLVLIELGVLVAFVLLVSIDLQLKSGIGQN